MRESPLVYDIGSLNVKKVKFFKSIESELNALEDEINKWLAQSGATLISVTGNIAPQSEGGTVMGSFSASDILVIVVYEEGNG